MIDGYKIVSETLNNTKISKKKSPIGPTQTTLSSDQEKAKEEKRFLTKLTILGTSVGISVSSWQLLRDPSLRKQIIDSIRNKNPKLLWSLYGIPIAGGIALDMISQPAIGWTAKKWQNAENKIRRRKKK
jgi:hypothetical protein